MGPASARWVADRPRIGAGLYDVTNSPAVFRVPGHLFKNGFHLGKYPFFFRKSVRSFSTREVRERFSFLAAISAAALRVGRTLSWTMAVLVSSGMAVLRLY